MITFQQPKKKLSDARREFVKGLLILAVFVLISAVLTYFASAFVPSDIISYYSQNTTAPGEWKDNMRVYNLTQNNMDTDTATNCKVGSCFYGDTAGDYTYSSSTMSKLNGQTHISIAACAKAKVAGKNGVMFYRGPTTNQLYLGTATARQIYVGVGTAYGYPIDGYGPSTTYWTCYVMVYNGSGTTNADKVKLYVNGSAKSLTFGGTVPTTTPTSTNLSFIGGRFPGVGIDWSGWIDEVIIFNKSLTPTEVSNVNSYMTNKTQVPYTMSETQKFMIYMKDRWNDSNLKKYNATVNGNFYSTTNGSITTTILVTNTSKVNVTIRAPGRFNNYTLNRTPSASLTGYTSQSIIRVVVQNYDTSAVITGSSLNFSGKTTGTTFYPGLGNKTLRASHANYRTNNTWVVVSGLENQTFTVKLDQYGYASIHSKVNNSLGNTSVFLNGTLVTGYCRSTHDNHDNGTIYGYMWKNNSNGFTTQGITFPIGLSPGYVTTGMIRETDSTMLMWGDNTHGEIGDNTTTMRKTPVSVIGGICFSSVTTGMGYGWGEHTCGLRCDNGRAMCWGSNGAGQVGDNTTTERHVPTYVTTTQSYIAIYGGYNDTCALTRDGFVDCWGYDADGQFGGGDDSYKLTPFRVSTNLRFSSLSTGYYHVCGITMNSSLLACWGRNPVGQVGDGTTSYVTTPKIISNDRFLSVSAGYHSTVALRADHRVLSWGYNADGRLVNGSASATNVLVPTLNAFSAPMLMIDTSDTHICGIRLNDSTILCGGWNWKGEVGDGTTTPRYSPVVVSSGVKWRYVRLGHTSVCASHLNDSAVYCWGRNEYGALGDNSVSDRWSPVRVLTNYTPRFYETNDQYELVSYLPVQYATPGSEWTFSCQAQDHLGVLSTNATNTFEFLTPTTPVHVGYWFITSNRAAWNVSITNVSSSVNLTASALSLNTTIIRNNGTVNLTATTLGYKTVRINNTYPWNNLTIIFVSSSAPVVPSLNGSVVINVAFSLKNETLFILSLAGMIGSQLLGPYTSLYALGLGLVFSFAVPDDYLDSTGTVMMGLRILNILLFLYFMIDRFWLEKKRKEKLLQ